MKKYRTVKPVERKKDGTIVLNLDATEDSSDWLKYGRLKNLRTQEIKRHGKSMKEWMLPK